MKINSGLLRILLVALVVAATTGLTPVGVAGPNEDASDQSTVKNPNNKIFAWEFDDPSTLNAYEVNDKVIKIKAKARQDMFFGKRMEAPLVTTAAPSGDWTLEAKYSLPARVSSSHCGLVIWDGRQEAPVHALYIGPFNKNQIRIEGSYSQAASAHSNVLTKLSGNKGTFEVNFAEVEGWLKITKSQEEYTFYFKSAEHQNWRLLGTVKTVDSFARVGFIAKTWGNQPVEVIFSEIKLS